MLLPIPIFLVAYILSCPLPSYFPTRLSIILAISPYSRRASSKQTDAMPSINQLADICIPMVDEPAYSNRRLRVVTIGAGFSGLILAHKIQHEFPDLQKFIDHTIFELQDDAGGTWKVNTYPGVQCDVPAHIYVSTSLIAKLSRNQCL